VPSSPSITYREIFFGVNGLGPFLCCFCGEDVTADEVLVHHANGDRQDNRPDNLKPAHRSCHTSYHKEEWWRAGNKVSVHSRSYESSEEIAEKTRLSWENDPERAIIQSERMRGLWADPEWSANQRERLKEGAKRRWTR